MSRDSVLFLLFLGGYFGSVSQRRVAYRVTVVGNIAVSWLLVPALGSVVRAGSGLVYVVLQDDGDSVH